MAEQNVNIGHRAITVRGCRMHYSEAASDASEGTMILLHGSGPGASGWSNFKANLPVLGSRFRTIAVDMPGWGESDSAGPGGLDHASSLLDFMDALGIAQAALVGNSMGAITALIAASEHSDRVSHLVTMGTGSGPGPKLFSAGDGMSEGMKLLVQAYETPTPEAMKKLVTVMTYDSDRFGTDELAAERANAAVKNPVHLREYLERLRTGGPIGRWFDLEALQSMTVPTLLIHGRDDRVMSYEHSLTLLGYIPDSRLLLINRCGHWAQLEHVEEFNRAVVDFVSNR